MADLKVPKFANETQEADWWFEHQDELADAFENASARGELGRGSVVQRAAEIAALTALLGPDDAARAQDLAAKRGVQYHLYLKMLLHEALKAESQKLAS